MVPDFPPRFRKLLEQDEVFRLLQTAGSESLKKLLPHFQSKNYVFTRSDLEIILKKEGDELDQLLKSGGYKPLEFSTGEDLDQAIESTTFIVPGWLPRGHLTAIVSSPGLGKTYVAGRRRSPTFIQEQVGSDGGGNDDQAGDAWVTGKSMPKFLPTQSGAATNKRSGLELREMFQVLGGEGVIIEFVNDLIHRNNGGKRERVDMVLSWTPVSPRGKVWGAVTRTRSPMSRTAEGRS